MNAIRHVFLCLLGALLCGISVLHAGEPAPQVNLKIDAQPLAAALNEWAKQTGYMVLVPVDDGARKFTAPPISGHFTPEAALKILLSDSGLSYQFVNARTVSIRALGNHAPRSSSAPEDESAKIFGNELQLAKNGAIQQVNATSNSESPSAADQSDASANDKTPAIQEIVVTAQKREERLQDVPISITALDGKDIERRGLVSAEDYLRGIPGVNQTDFELGQTIVIRGLAASMAFQNGSGGSTTATYFGETPTTTSAGNAGGTAIDIKLVDIQRVEILRGPQGTAFGSSALAGAVRTIPEPPKLDRYEGKLLADYSSTSRFGSSNYDVQAVANIPLVQDRLGLRAVGYRFDTSGYYRNVAGSTPHFRAEAIRQGAEAYAVDKDEVGATVVVGGRIAVLFQATDALKFTLSYLTQRTEIDGHARQTEGAYQVASMQVAPENRARGSKDYVFDMNIDLANAQVEYDLGWANLLATYSDVKSGAEFASGAYTNAFSAHVDGPHREHIGEIRLATRLDGAWNFLGGLYSEQVTDNSVTDLHWFGSAELNPFGTNRELFHGTGENNLRQKAAFAEATWQFLPRTTATVGARVYDYERTGYSDGRGIFSTGVLDLSTEASGTSYRANLSHKLTENALLYGGWAQGFRLGRPQAGLTPELCDLDHDGIVDGTGLSLNATRRIDSDAVDSYELGGKFTMLDGRLLVTTAAFRMDWTGVPFLTTVKCPGYPLNSSYIANGGGARSEGVEFEVNSYVTRAFRVDFGGSWIKAQFTKPVPAANVAVGDQLPGGAEFNGNVGLQYEFTIGGSPAFVRADSIYVGPFISAIGNGMGIAQGRSSGDYLKVDVSAQVAIRNATISLYARNLMNEDAFTFGGDYPRPGGELVGSRMRPRTVGLQLGYRF